MSLYIFIFIILFSFSLIEVGSNNIQYSKICFSVLLFCLFILSFIRWETGTDWESYNRMYEWVKIPWQNFDTSMEWGFTVVNHLGKYLFNSYTGVLFIFAVIIFSCNYNTYIFFSPYPITTLLFSFCVIFANIFFVRQGVACAILLISIKYIEQRKIIPFVLLVFIASLFHISAWIFLLSYICYHQRFSIKAISLLSIFIVLFSIIGSNLLFSFIGDLGMGIISQKTANYVELGTDDNSMAYSTTSVIVKGLINRLFLLFITLYSLRDQRKVNIRINGLINIYLLGTMLYCITIPLSISLARMAVYMDLVQLFLIATIIKQNSILSNRLIIFIFFAIYYLSRFFAAFYAYKVAYVPFKTIF